MDIVEDAFALKLKLNSILNGTSKESRNLADIFKTTVCQINKPILEGYYLFTIYLLYILKENKRMLINTTTIRRCMRHVLKDSDKSRSTGDAVEDALILHVRNTFFNFSTDDRKDDFIKDKSSTKPMEYMANMLCSNIKLHIRNNFKRFQNKYLKCQLNRHIGNHQIAKSNINFIVYAIQQKINGNTSFSHKKEENIKKYNLLSEKLNIGKLIESETKILKEYIPNAISSNKELPAFADEYTFDYLRYFRYMLNDVIKCKIKRFSIIPHCVPKIRHINLDARSLCTVYNKWKQYGKNNFITIPDFEKNFKMYFNEMFNISTKYRKILVEYPDVRSISTDGICVSITFEKLKTVHYIKQTKDEKEKVKQVKNNAKKDGNEKNKLDKAEKDKVKKPVELLNFESIINSIKYNTLKMYDVATLETTDEYLKKFCIGGVDIGNEDMLDIHMENGLHFKVNKNYYNNVAHVICNKESMSKYISDSKMNEIYSEMSLEHTKTTDITEFMKYVECVRKNWVAIWKFCESKSIANLKFDSYVYKQKAISRIAQEIVANVRNKNNVYPKHKEFFNEDKFNEDLKKPLLLAIGTGSGNITISNTKHSTPKGPLKQLIRELSKYCIVILVPEFNTSQICCECNNFLEDVYTYKFPSKNSKKYVKCTEMEKAIMDIEIDRTIENKHRVHKNKELLSINKNILNKSSIRVIEDETIRLEKDTIEMGHYGASYKLRRCANRHVKNNNRCILWERNINASRNMSKMMRNILITKTQGHFRNKKEARKECLIRQETIRTPKRIIQIGQNTSSADIACSIHTDCDRS